MAAKQGNLHTVRHLIDEGTDVNVKDDGGVRIKTNWYTDLSLNYPNRKLLREKTFANFEVL